MDVLQVKSLDVQRFLTRRGQLTATLMVEVGAAIAAIIDHQ